MQHTGERAAKPLGLLVTWVDHKKKNKDKNGLGNDESTGSVMIGLVKTWTI
jgi:hypothetical protein